MKTYYRRKLPHWIPPDSIFFITFRLVNSLPVNVIERLKKEKIQQRKILLKKFTGEIQKQKLYTLNKKYFGYFDNWLDKCITESPLWLGEDKIAQVVASTIHNFDGRYYFLLSYCIMPNHVHLFIDMRGKNFNPIHDGTTKDYPLSDIMKRLKGSTARLANQILNRSGSFWQNESYDHVVRDAEELERIHWYILQNPVKAGLVSRWEDWPFSWSRFVSEIL